MKAFLLSMVWLGIAGSLFAQSGITFTVEKLSRPGKYLPVQSPDHIYKKLILDEVNLSLARLQKDNLEFPFGIIAQSHNSDSLVSFGSHSFFQGMYHAYADHRPFVLSPDMIWLLISQGFAQHVQAHAEQMRSLFVDHQGKKVLEIRDDRIRLDDPDSPWEEVFPRFADTLDQYVHGGLIDLLSADFSTTTPADRIASQITLMKAMEPYFQYIVVTAICGIPEITLLGTPEDWQKILDKTRRLADYDLAWWTDELIPILEKIEQTSRGEIDRAFWRNMFKKHSTGQYGGIYFDGWIVRFFPYDREGHRNNLQQLNDPARLPDEIVKVDLLHIYEWPDGRTLATPLKLWAGFIGLEQDSQTFALKPHIGWMIRKVETAREARRLAFQKGASTQIEITTDTFPSELLQLDSIRWLDLTFTDQITIPDELAHVKIAHLNLSGKIDRQQKQRLIERFPDTDLFINSDRYYYRHGEKRTCRIESLSVPVKETRYRERADRILRENIAPDFDKVIQYQATTTRDYKPYDILDPRYDYADREEGVRVSYKIVLNTGQRIYYHLSGGDYSIDMDREGQVLDPPAGEYSLDWEFLRQVYALSAQNDFLTWEQADSIARKHTPARYTKKGLQRMIYDRDTKRFYWGLEYYYGSRRGAILHVELDAITGEILKSEEIGYEGMRYW